MVRSLKFCIYQVEGLFYLCVKAEALHGYRTADLLLCFAYAKSRFSHDAAFMGK